jgi:type IV pilus assembly protein PilF
MRFDRPTIASSARPSPVPFACGVIAMAASCALCLPACISKASNYAGAKSPERQSEAEYDVARDFFFKADPRSALDHGLKAVELDDENAKALYFVSSVYLYFCQASDSDLAAPDCRLSDAERYARLALKTDDTFRDARNLLGNVLTLREKYGEAIAVLAPLTKDPSYTETHLAWGNLGWAQLLSGALDDGIASLKNSITQPRFCVGHYRLGYAFEKKGDLRLAEQSVTAALSVESSDCQNMQEAWALRGRVRMRLGKIADARADFEKCQELSAESRVGRACTQQLGAAKGNSPVSRRDAAPVTN